MSPRIPVLLGVFLKTLSQLPSVEPASSLTFYYLSCYPRDCPLHCSPNTLRPFLHLVCSWYNPHSPKTFSPTFYMDPSPTKPIHINLWIPVTWLHCITQPRTFLPHQIVKSNKDNCKFSYLKVHFTACYAPDQTVAEQCRLTFWRKMNSSDYSAGYLHPQTAQKHVNNDFRVSTIFSFVWCHVILQLPWEMEILTIAWKVWDELERSLKKVWSIFQAYDSQGMVFYRKFYCERNIQPFRFLPFIFFSLSFKLLVNETQATLWSFTQLCRSRLPFLPHTLLSTNPQKQGKISLCHVLVLSCFLFFNDETNNRRKNPLTKLVSTLAKRWAAWLLPASLIKVSSLLFVYIYYLWRISPPSVFMYLFPFLKSHDS